MSVDELVRQGLKFIGIASLLVPSIIVGLNLLLDMCRCIYYNIIQLIHYRNVVSSGDIEILSHYAETGCKEAAKLIVDKNSNILSLSANSVDYCVSMRRSSILVGENNRISLVGKYCTIHIIKKSENEYKILDIIN